MRAILIAILICVADLASASPNSDISDAVVEVVVPQYDDGGISAGQMIEPRYMKIRKFSSRDVPNDYVSPKYFGKIDGRTVRGFIKNGEPVRYSEVVDFAMQYEIDNLELIIQKLMGCSDRCEDQYTKLLGK